MSGEDLLPVSEDGSLHCHGPYMVEEGRSLWGPFAMPCISILETVPRDLISQRPHLLIPHMRIKFQHRDFGKTQTFSL